MMCAWRLLVFIFGVCFVDIIWRNPGYLHIESYAVKVWCRFGFYPVADGLPCQPVNVSWCNVHTAYIDYILRDNDSYVWRIPVRFSARFPVMSTRCLIIFFYWYVMLLIILYSYCVSVLFIAASCFTMAYIHSGWLVCSAQLVVFGYLI